MESLTGNIYGAIVSPISSSSTSDQLRGGLFLPIVTIDSVDRFVRGRSYDAFPVSLTIYILCIVVFFQIISINEQRC